MITQIAKTVCDVCFHELSADTYTSEFLSHRCTVGFTIHTLTQAKLGQPVTLIPVHRNAPRPCGRTIERGDFLLQVLEQLPLAWETTGRSHLTRFFDHVLLVHPDDDHFAWEISRDKLTVAKNYCDDVDEAKAKGEAWIKAWVAERVQAFSADREEHGLPDVHDALGERPRSGQWVMGLRDPKVIWWRCPTCDGQVPLARDEVARDGYVEPGDMPHSQRNEAGRPMCSWSRGLFLRSFDNAEF